MAGKGEQAKVTLVIGSDEASFRNALQQIETLKTAIERLARGAGATEALPTADASRKGGLPAPPPPTDPATQPGWGTAGGRWAAGPPPSGTRGLPPTGSVPGTSGGPDGGGGFGTLVLNNVQTVMIQGSAITLNVQGSIQGNLFPSALGLPPGTPVGNLGGITPGQGGTWTQQQGVSWPQTGLSWPGQQVPAGDVMAGRDWLGGHVARLVGGGSLGAAVAGILPFATLATGIGYAVHTGLVSLQRQAEASLAPGLLSAQQAAAAAGGYYDPWVSRVEMAKARFEAQTAGIRTIIGAIPILGGLVESDVQAKMEHATALAQGRSALERTLQRVRAGTGRAAAAELETLYELAQPPDPTLIRARNVMIGMGLAGPIGGIAGLLWPQPDKSEEIEQLARITSMADVAWRAPLDEARRLADFYAHETPEYGARLAEMLAQAALRRPGGLQALRRGGHEWQRIGLDQLVAEHVVAGQPFSHEMYAAGIPFLGRQPMQDLEKLGVESTFEMRYGAAALASAQAYTTRVMAAGGGAIEFTGGVTLMLQAIENLQTALYKKLSVLDPNSMEFAELMVEVQRLDAEKATLQRQQRQSVYQEATTIAGARFGEAQADYRRSMLTGTSTLSAAGTYQGGAVVAAARRRVEVEIEMLERQRPYLSVAEQAQREMEIARLQLDEIETARQIAMGRQEERISVVEYKGARVEHGIERARLFGTPSAIAAATTQQLGIIDERVQAERDYINELRKAGATQAEINRSLMNIQRLETERERLVENIVREQYAGEQRITGFQLAGAAAGRTLATIRYGSLAGLGDAGAQLQAAQSGAARARQEYAEALARGVDPNSEYMQALEADIRQRELSVTQISVGLADYVASPQLRREMTRGRVALHALTTLHSQWGSVRGAYQYLLGGINRQMEELDAQTQAALRNARPEDRAAILARAEEQRAELMMQAIGIQQQLEMGWMERIISQVHHAPSSFSIASSQFTQREGALYYGIANRYFGGTSEMADYWRRQGPLTYYAHFGTGRPDDNTARALASVAGANYVEVGGRVHVDITLRDDKGNALTETSTQVNINQATGAFQGPPKMGFMRGS